MEIELEDVIEELAEFKNTVYLYLDKIGYSAADIENLLGDLEERLMETGEV